MKHISLVILAFALFSLAACSSKQVSLSDLPTFPGATAVKPGDDPVADTLMKNMEQDASLRTDLGVAGGIEQAAHQLPANSSWEDVKNFYDEELSASGWESGLGGIAGGFANDALEAAAQVSETALWSRGKQTLTLVRLVDPTDQTALYLIFSLNTN